MRRSLRSLLVIDPLSRLPWRGEAEVKGEKGLAGVPERLAAALSSRHSLAVARIRLTAPVAYHKPPQVLLYQLLD
jgi:hypothetical protein